MAKSVSFWLQRTAGAFFWQSISILWALNVERPCVQDDGVVGGSSRMVHGHFFDRLERSSGYPQNIYCKVYLWSYLGTSAKKFYFDLTDRPG